MKGHGGMEKKVAMPVIHLDTNLLAVGASVVKFMM